MGRGAAVRQAMDGIQPHPEAERGSGALLSATVHDSTYLKQPEGFPILLVLGEKYVDGLRLREIPTYAKD